MAKSKTNPAVDFYFNKNNKWDQEITKLRAIILNTGLDEELKWGVPCYTLDKKNIVLIHVFKEYCAILFIKGALLEDPDKLLIQQTKNVQSARQMRFTSASEINKLKSSIRKYVLLAIETEKSGEKIKLKKTKEFEMPEEFKLRLNQSKELKKAFQSLTPGRQRGYLLYFSSPKQSKTRESRVEKYVNRILNGEGLNDI